MSVEPGKSSDPIAKTKAAKAPKLVNAHHDERVATDLARYAGSRERFDVLLKLIYGLVVIVFLSTAANIWFGLQETRYLYFAVNPEGIVTPVLPLDRPIQSTSELLNWTTTSLTKAFTMSFANYRQQMAESRLSFTTPGWAGFEQALRQTKVVSTIIEQKLVTSAVPQGAPVVVSQGIGEGGRYGWRVEMPILVTYESASDRKSVTLNIEAVIMRRPESEHPSGLGIDKIIAR